MTRIVAGTARGRHLASPRGLDTRPTSEKVRAAIFNVLGQFFEGGEVLDLYAGTGALALEALSRGFDRATCVESGRMAARVIRENAGALGFGDRVEVLEAPLPGALARLPRDRFGLAFVDPPYAAGPAEVLAGLGALLLPGARVVAEHDARRPPPDTFPALVLEDRRAWGSTGISIYRRE